MVVIKEIGYLNEVLWQRDFTLPRAKMNPLAPYFIKQRRK